MDLFDLRLWEGFVTAGGQTHSCAPVDQIAIDSRRIDSKQALFIALEGKYLDGHRFIHQAIAAGARYAIVRKGYVPSKPVQGTVLLEVEDPVRALQQIAGAYRKQQRCLMVAIAGSHGKTMVKDLLLSMLATTRSAVASPESFNSQIGVPLSLLTIRQSHDIALIEAAISKENEMDRLCEIIDADCTIITHIGKKHLATLGSLETVAKETMKLTSSSRKQQWALLPQDPLVAPYVECLQAHHFWNTACTSKPHARFLSQERGSTMPYCVHFPDGHVHQGEINCGFYYFLDLINITVKAAWLLGISASAISRVLQEYRLEPMRTEIWKSAVGTTFVNDTYCCDPQSVDRALSYFQHATPSSRKFFVFGGMRSHHHAHVDVDYRRIGKAIHAAQVDRLLLYGRPAFDALIDEVKTLSPHTEISYDATCQKALERVKSHVSSEDTVLVKGEYKQPLDAIIEMFNESAGSNQCVINLAAISSNLVTIRSKLAPFTRIMVMVKALAYGTDEVRMAKFLQTCDVDILGVSYVEEGVALKRAGVKQDIFVINAAIYEAAKVVKWGLEIGVSDAGLIKAAVQEAVKQNKKIKVHLHIDTGMSRFGCRPEEALSLARLILSQPALELVGLMTHFASADDPDADAFTFAQVKCFEEVIGELEKHGIRTPWHHAANSSAALRFGLHQFNMARIGLAVYGLCPSEAVKKAADLRLALSLFSRIVGINVCKKGETVSYGRSYLVELEEQKIAVLPIGYFDGLHRNYSGKSAVIIRGKKAPMVGRICMDFMMVDVTHIPNASPGDPVLIFGEDEHGHYLSAEELAKRGDSIVHELITCLGPRIQRVFVYEEGGFSS